MRKLVTLSIIAAAAMLVTACGKSESTNAAADANAMVTEMNASEAMEGTINDSMTNVDGAMGASDNMTAGNATADNAAAESSGDAAAPANAAGNAACKQ